MHTLFRMLTSENITFSSEAVITSLEYNSDISDNSIVQILAHSKRRMRCKIQDASGALVVTMIALPPNYRNSSRGNGHRNIVAVDSNCKALEANVHFNARGEIYSSTRVKETIDTDCLTFTVEEILEFVEDVKDNNFIHRKEPYIVPGCLLLEKVYDYVSYFTAVQSMEIKFLQPVMANDVIILEHDDYNVIGKVMDTIVFKVIYKEDFHE